MAHANPIPEGPGDTVQDTDDLDVSGGVTDDPGVEEVGGHPESEDEPALDVSPF